MDPTQTLSIALSATPPTEFRLFQKGWNSTTKGDFLFDDEAAASVMAAYEAHGVDLAIDLEHQALEPESSADPTARDARGWFGLEVRDGDLYAVNVKWTDDGAARLTEKRQRYISPAFTVDPETQRVTKIINAALTAIPATHQTPALIAASQRKNETMANEPKPEPNNDQPPTLADAIAALEAGDVENALAIMKALAEAPAATDAPAVEDKAARATNLRATSTRTLSAAAAEVKALAKERQALAKERDEYANAERVRLCRSLVVDAGRAPAAVWQQDAYAAGQTPVPKPFLQRMTIVELRAHVAEEVASNGGGRRTKRGSAHDALTPPVGNGDGSGGGKIVRASYGEVELSAREMAMFANQPDADARMKHYVESNFVRRRHEERQAGGGQ